MEEGRLEREESTNSENFPPNFSQTKFKQKMKEEIKRAC